MAQILTFPESQEIRNRLITFKYAELTACKRKAHTENFLENLAAYVRGCLGNDIVQCKYMENMTGLAVVWRTGQMEMNAGRARYISQGTVVYSFEQAKRLFEKRQ